MKNQNKIYSILKVTLVFFTLLFITIGCENGHNESSDLKESSKQIQSLNEKSAIDAEDEELGVIVELCRLAGNKEYANIIKELFRNIPQYQRNSFSIRQHINRG